MSNYLLPYEQYTLYNAICWGNFHNHLKNICNDEGDYWKSACHFTIAVIEFIPIIGQIVSVFELCIAYLYYDCFYDLALLNAPPPFPPRPQPRLRAIGGEVTDRALIHFPQMQNSTPISYTTAVWERTITPLLDPRSLNNLRQASHGFNNMIVSSPTMARRISLSQHEIFVVDPRPFFVGGTCGRNFARKWRAEAELTMIRIQRVLREFQEDFELTSNLLEIIQEELATDTRSHTTPVLLVCLTLPAKHNDPYSPNLGGRLALCRRSTSISLFVQLIFQNMYHFNYRSLKINNPHFTLDYSSIGSPNHAKSATGTWTDAIAALAIIPQQLPLPSA